VVYRKGELSKAEMDRQWPTECGAAGVSLHRSQVPHDPILLRGAAAIILQLPPLVS
jgi:hypothetical protein